MWIVTPFFSSKKTRLRKPLGGCWQRRFAIRLGVFRLGGFIRGHGTSALPAKCTERDSQGPAHCRAFDWFGPQCLQVQKQIKIHHPSASLSRSIPPICVRIRTDWSGRNWGQLFQISKSIQSQVISWGVARRKFRYFFGCLSLSGHFSPWIWFSSGKNNALPSPPQLLTPILPV
jgi:hypothetical protein